MIAAKAQGRKGAEGDWAFAPLPPVLRAFAPLRDPMRSIFLHLCRLLVCGPKSRLFDRLRSDARAELACLTAAPWHVWWLQEIFA